MEGTFLEFENENALRAYPFASGTVRGDGSAAIPQDVFVDAVLYPVNPVGTLYLSSVSEAGVVSVSDDTGVVMSGEMNGRLVELYDKSSMHRHVGTLVASSEGRLAEFVGTRLERSYASEDGAFASSCVFPMVADGVTSVSVGGTGAISGVVGFLNGPSDQVRVSSGVSNSHDTLRFDVVPSVEFSKERSIRRIICVVDGQTPFRIERLSYNTIMLRLDPSIDKEAVCAYAHREASLEMSDTCECDDDHEAEGGSVNIPDTYQMEEVFIPSSSGDDGGMSGGAENAFYLVVPNLVGYSNPLSITLEDGLVVPKTDYPEIEVHGLSAELNKGELMDDVTSKGVVLQVPGLSGGQI